VIFVTLGTQAYPFDRLLRGLEGVDEELVVQGGVSTYRPAGAAWFDYLEYPEVLEHVRRARVLVSHAGVGSVMTAVAEGKRPVVMTRLRRFGEAVDDHQVPFAQRLAAIGLVTLVEAPEALRPALADPPALQPRAASESSLAADLRGYLLDVAEAT
jgi:UDP-N-acetylglucosamine transferase subunit ALG13